MSANHDALQDSGAQKDILSNGRAADEVFTAVDADFDNKEDGKGELADDSIEACIADKRLGRRIRALRQKESMGLVELGRHTGLSASFLSQLETGRVVPTLRNLARIALVFSKDLSYFFQAEPQPLFRVHRVHERVRLPQSGVDEPLYFFESLGYLVADRQLDPYLAEFQPKPGGELRTHHHFGCEFLYLLNGRLKIHHGESSYELAAGDSVYFDSSTAHSYQCEGDEPASAIIVTLQQPLEPVSARPGVKRGTRPLPANGATRRI